MQRIARRFLPSPHIVHPCVPTANESLDMSGGVEHICRPATGFARSPSVPAQGSGSWRVSGPAQ
jgi:hypothetical protein